MSVTVDKLKKMGLRRTDLDATIREQLLLIDERLLQLAGRAYGQNVLAYELPVTLVAPNIDRKTAQQIVYSAIIQSLKERGFDVRILLEEKCTILYIKWVTDIDPVELNAMDRLIREAQVVPADADKLCSRGREKGTARRPTS